MEHKKLGIILTVLGALILTYGIFVYCQEPTEDVCQFNG